RRQGRMVAPASAIAINPPPAENHYGPQRRGLQDDARLSRFLAARDRGILPAARYRGVDVRPAGRERRKTLRAPAQRQGRNDRDRGQDQELHKKQSAGGRGAWRSR